MRTAPFLLAFALAPFFLISPARAADPGSWTQWRGPNADGTAPGATPPVEWSETKNVKWKVELPGGGTSTPVILGDRVYLTTAVPAEKPGEAPAADAKPADQAPPPPPAPAGGGERRRGGGGGGGRNADAPERTHRFQLLCLDRATGKTLWTGTAAEEKPHEGHHQDHGFASHSPIVEGDRVYAFFGSRGLHCFDTAGKLIWSKHLGQMRTRNAFGEGSSPVLSGDTLVVNWDHEGEDFVAAFDKNNGAEKWRQQRDEPTSWATPLAITADGKTQVVINATNRIRSYDLATGEQLWECGGMTTNAIPSPVTGNGMVYVLSGFRGSALRAIKLGRTGDLTDTDAVAWSYDTKTPYVPSPLLDGGRLYFFSQNTGILTCLDAKTGKVLIDAARIDGLQGVYASPVAANGKVYLTGRNGEGIVLKAADTLEVLATNRLDEKFDASPAIAGKELFLRGHKYLYCLSE